MKRIKTLLVAVICAVACAPTVKLSLTDEENRLITGSPEVMRVLTVNSPEDSIILRQACRNFNVPDINTPEYQTLARKMVATLIAAEGVGIAGPQVGINRRIIAVQRFDKPGEPIEVYANPYIVETRGDKVVGPEGCLSVPGRRGDVPRWREITVGYTDPHSDMIDSPRTVFEEISGFTAVIFQHEIDHLDGVIYTDHLGE